MEPRQEINYRQSLNQAILHSLEILSLPQLELAAHLQQEIEKNPLLEEVAHGPRKPLPELASPPSLHEALLAQIRETFSDTRDQHVALELMSHLDERGFLTISCPAGAELILEKLQQFDPPGIFARSLRECFLIQLERKGEQKSVAYQLVSISFGDLLDGQYSHLHKRYGADVGPALQRIGRLTTRPTDAFLTTCPIHILPDLHIEQIQETWKIVVDESALPRLHLKEEYLNVPATSPERATLRSWAASAKWLFRSLERRKTMLFEIGVFLSKKQALYLNHKGPLERISKQEIADVLGVHESTISRAIHGKFVATPRGMMALSNLIPSYANTNAKELLLQLIAEEDKRVPLTDQQLADALQGAGFPVARRTIAKYRKSLDIGDTSLRSLIGSFKFT